MSIMKKAIVLIALFALSISNVYSQSKVDLGSGLRSTKYYESMNSSNPPASNWYAVDFDDSGWKDYKDPFYFPVNDAFWIRRTFVITDDPSSHNFQIKLAHDDESRIYINGIEFHNCGGCGRYCVYDIPRAYLVKGVNVLAVSVYDSGGGTQYLECDISTTDGSDIIMDIPNQPMFFLSSSEMRLYLYEGLSKKTITTTLISPLGKVESPTTTWTSSNPDVVSVVDGQLTALCAGKAVITARTTYGSTAFEEKCSVEVCALDPKARVISVEIPGKLESLLTDEEKENIDNLILIGKLNGSDIQVLRYMTGRNERGNRTPGMLADLDIYNVEFVNDGQSIFYIGNNQTVYMYDDGRLPEYIFQNCVALNTIVLPESVHRIGYGAFNGCSSLEEVVMPTGLLSIDGSAFGNCSKLKSVEIPSSVNTLGNDAFRECRKLESITFGSNSKLSAIQSRTFYETGLKSINIPASVTSIGEYAFYYCSVADVTFEEGSRLTEINQWAFSNCRYINSIVLPDGCLEIGEGSFYDNENLVSVTIPSSLVSIGRGAFVSCFKLSRINIPENSKLIEIDESAFEGTCISSLYIPKGLLSISGVFSNDSQLQSLTVHPDNKNYESIGGIIYSKRDKSVVLVPKSIEGYLTFPDYVTTIPDNLLQGCSKLRGIVLNSGITYIGNSAFSGCSNLQTLMSLSATPATVAAASFDGISRENVTLIVPQGSLDAYSKANGWKDFYNIEEVGDQPKILLSANNVVLYDVNYESARKATVSVTVISKNTISSVPVTWTTSNENVAKVAGGVIECVGPGDATITASVYIDGYSVSASCSVTTVSASDGKLVFVDQPGTLSTLLTKKEKDDITHLIVMGDLNSDDIRELRYMAGRDEYGNQTVGSLEILDMSKARIVSGGNGYYFQDGWWRTASNDRFYQDIFRSCYSLKKIVLPQTLTHIDSYAFYECVNLEEVVLPEGLTVLGSEAFNSCPNLAFLAIPSTVKTIEWNVFYNCKGLKSIQFLGSEAPDLDASTFNGVSIGSIFVIVPAGSTGYKTKQFWNNVTNMYETDRLPLLVMKDKNVELYNINSDGAKTLQLKAFAITELGTTSAGIAWSSSNSSIVSVSETGIVTAGDIEGDAIITASYTVGDKTLTADCSVSVIDLADYKFINVAQAGTLSSLLTEDEKLDTKKLIVSGELNSLDIRVLRYMSGRDEYGNLTAGSLETLNMSKAKIVYGGEGYMLEGNYWRYGSDNMLGERVFENCTALKKIIIPTSVTYIGWNAFYGCSNLETVVLPEGLTYIGSSAFSYCKKLTSINLPSSITNIEGSIFCYCQSLKSIDLSTLTGVSRIPNDMFGQSGLTSVVIPSHIKTVESCAFSGAPLQKVQFEDGSQLITIGDGAFQSTHLQTITIPASVLNIGNYAFNDCRKLKEVIYEENNKLNALGNDVFNGCPIQTFFIPKRLISMGRQDFSEYLNEIVVEEGNKSFESFDGALCSKTDGSLVYVPKRKKSLYLPDYVTSLKDGVLQYHYDLQMIVLPVNISDLGDSPFYQCNNLREIYCLNPKAPMARNLTNDFPQATVFVAEGCKNTYLEAGWDDWRITLVEHSYSNSISLTSSEMILYNVEGGNNVKLEAKVFSTGGPLPYAAIEWTSSDQSVVVVDANGMLTYAGPGTAIITASITLDGTVYSQNCLVTTKTIENVENTNFVFVETAGNLRNQIAASDKYNITNLVVFGNINSSDIRFIREMARIPEAFWSSVPEDGSLEYLDLSGATIVQDYEQYGCADWTDENGSYSSWVGTQANVIGKSMFRKSPILKTIVLPSSVTMIDYNAFSDCPKLEKVVLPNGLSYIAGDAFDNCPSIVSDFIIPESIDSLGAYALRGFDVVYAKSTTPAKLLGSPLVGEEALVIVPAEALQTYRGAEYWKQFAGQIVPDNLNIQTVVTLNVTAETDGSGLLTAAGGDDALAFIKDLTLKGTINSYDIAMIRNRMPRLHNLDLSDVRIVANPYEYYTGSHTENNRLGQNAFRELNKLRKVVLPKSIDYIGYNAFYDCRNLVSVKMYNGLNTIDDNAFSNCWNLTEVELPEGLLSIGYYAFSNCSQLEQITMPSTVLSIGSGAFQSCGSLKSIVLPKNVSRIDYDTFSYCYSLETVVLPAKVNRIEYYAFYGCSKLKELRLPPMIESIGDRAFDNCNNIKDVYVYIANSKDIKIDMNTFSCWTSATLHIPNFSYHSYFYDTQWGQFYTKLEFEENYDEFYTKNTLVLDAETGTIKGDPSAVLYEQGGLVVEDVDQSLESVELRSDGNNGASLIASGNGTITASKLTVSITINPYEWYFFAFPFDIPLDSIRYDGEYVWRQYDGEARSRREGGWQNLAEGTTALNKGRGYIFQGTASGYLKFTIDDPDLTAKDETTSLFTHESTNPQDANWNFVGNPYTSYYNIDENTYSAPITVWTGYGYEAYRPGDDDYQFSPYQAFFVQTPANVSEINFNANDRSTYEGMMETQANKAALRASMRKDNSRLFINLEVSEPGNSSYTDKTRIVFNNNKSLSYEQNCDAAKFFSESRSIELYSLDSDGTMYSINERPVNNGIVDLGISVNKAGDYVLSAVRMDTPVLLIDNELDIVFDLSNGSYSFTADRGQSQRFTVKLGNDVTKVIDHMNSESDDDSFDLQGRRINGDNGNGIIIRNGRKVLENK